MSAARNPATVADCLRLGAGFSAGELPRLVAQFGTLDARLATFDADSTDLELSVKDRENRGQKVTLECNIAGQRRIVAVSGEQALHDALNDVRDDLRRQLDDAKTRREPRNNRHLRENVVPEPTAAADDLIPTAQEETTTGER